MFRYYGPPPLAGVLFPAAKCTTGKEGVRELVLTFDDGPDPESTPRILDIIDRHGIRAVFFCNGEAYEKHTALYHDIKKARHQTGSHGYRHISGNRLTPAAFLDNLLKPPELAESRLFRPPYGFMNLRQYRLLIRYGRIILWDVMAYDFDATLPSAKVMKTVLARVKPGSVIVMHDKPGSHALNILDEMIRRLFDAGYSFTLIPDT